MLSKCANPSCGAPFRSLREGKLFHFESEPKGGAQGGLHIVGVKKRPQRVEHYWLCAQCSATMTLSKNGAGVTLVTLASATVKRAKRAAAS